MVGCSSVLTAPDGTFNSPYYPEIYANYWNCSYFITVDNSSVISLLFDNLQLTDGYDFVRVYDGPSTSSQLLALISGEFSLTTSPSVVSSTNELLVVYTTGNRGGSYYPYTDYKGSLFHATYKSVTKRWNWFIGDIRQCNLDDVFFNYSIRLFQIRRLFRQASEIY